LRTFTNVHVAWLPAVRTSPFHAVPERSTLRRRVTVRQSTVET
jgi:hypothetical protein